MMDWLGKIIGLPHDFLNCSDGKGGGMIQATASEATLVALFGAKARTIDRLKKDRPELTEFQIISKLVAYCSSKECSIMDIIDEIFMITSYFKY